MTEKENSDTVSKIVEVKEVKKTVTITEFIQNGIETVLRYIFFWESNDTKFGMIIQLMHHAFIYGIILWYLYLHTFSDSYLQYVLFCFIFFLYGFNIFFVVHVYFLILNKN